MIRFLDGPADGTELSLRRAPRFLRVVVDAKGRIDALDLLDDVAGAGETVHVYQGDVDTLMALPDDIFVCTSGPGGLRQAGGAEGVYRHRGDVEGEPLRDTATWRSWVTEEVERQESAVGPRQRSVWTR